MGPEGDQHLPEALARKIYTLPPTLQGEVPKNRQIARGTEAAYRIEQLLANGTNTGRDSKRSKGRGPRR